MTTTRSPNPMPLEASAAAVLPPDGSAVVGRIAPSLPDTRPKTQLPQQIDTDDARWSLAIATHQRMTGSVLRPDARAKLMKIGGVMGLNPFQINLIIAVVQDAARRGLGPASAIDQLLFIPPALTRGNWSTALRWAIGLLVAEAALLVWLLS